ncbi:co-chaperone YbbN [Bacteriovorax sp. Seq25_V]|uniref:thioredoxin family protein n=1 Tax=Bacteriovorax sp. Seq25_V TaxID=1201288 RepID=UPI00038A5198|nr:thioredoxin family protein [Bacteriovorax sp. Seq25_V]EQC43879.1 thioredoxin domain protein [Bacteriovorax sp. Seq25_V]
MDYILTSENFDSSVNALNRPYIIKFGSETCGPCQTMKPVLEKFRESYPEIKLFEVDTDQSPELASHFEIRSVPTIHICEGREILYSFYGVTPFRDLEFVITNIDQPYFREHGQFEVEKQNKSYSFEILIILLLVIFIGAFIFLSL